MKETEEEKLIRILGVSVEEAKEIIAYDKAVDKGEATEYDLTAEQEKVVKQMRQADRKPNSKPAQTRQRKENPTKGAIISELAAFLTENSENACENVEIVNKERQITFEVGGQKFDLTLIAKRQPKK